MPIGEHIWSGSYRPVSLSTSLVGFPEIARPRKGLTSSPMCGIVAVLRRRSDTRAPAAEPVLQDVEQALAALALGPGRGPLAGAAELLETVDARLKGVAGVKALLHSP